MNKEELNEVKKMLYKEKPIATLNSKSTIKYYYSAVLESGYHVFFIVPIDDMGEHEFTDQMPAQLLIRWIDKDDF